jgi:uncharacterized protein (DUF697 family)/tellurite resistance protein
MQNADLGDWTMTESEQKAILTLCLMAAFADGGKDERERTEIKRIAESMGAGGAVNLVALYQDVLLRRVTPEQAAAALGTPELKQLAFEMAVCVCDADDARSDEESAFLERLSGLLGLAAAPSRRFEEEADALAGSALTEPAVSPVHAGTLSAAEMDKMILNYSILNGALELLPESLASMAIIPLQMKMVYRIGKSYGFELDRGHVKDFLATLGVGLTSQYVEQIGRKLIGGLLGKMAGGLGRAAGSTLTGAAFSFASTYALGQVARTYYSGGRTLDAGRLKESFSQILGEAKELQQRYAGEIQEKARTIDPSRIVEMVRQT